MLPCRVQECVGKEDKQDLHTMSKLAELQILLAVKV